MLYSCECCIYSCLGGIRVLREYVKFRLQLRESNILNFVVFEKFGKLYATAVDTYGTFENGITMVASWLSLICDIYCMHSLSCFAIAK
jgi:hypothetical protein